MTKDEFAEYLRDKGFKAVNEGGCVIIITPDKHDLKLMEKMVKETGYIGSRGWRDVNYAEH